MTTPHLFIFGLGYTSVALARLCLSQGWRVSGTTRSVDKSQELQKLGVEIHPFPSRDARRFHSITHILSSVPPQDGGDPVLLHHQQLLQSLTPQWVGYLSSTGVYGDHHGAWVDEKSELRGQSPSAVARWEAEKQWRALGAHVFRISGIYGPGRSVLETIQSGTAQRVVKEGLVFSRIHVEDLAQVLFLSLGKPDPGGVYNVADDLPAPPQDVVLMGCELLGVTPPVERRFEDVQGEMSAVLRGFYSECRRVSNERIKKELGVVLKFPDYRTGLVEIHRGLK